MEFKGSTRTRDGELAGLEAAERMAKPIPQSEFSATPAKANNKCRLFMDAKIRNILHRTQTSTTKSLWFLKFKQNIKKRIFAGILCTGKRGTDG